MNIVWTPEAEQDRLAIWQYLLNENPTAAVDMDLLFEQAVNLLVDHPKAGAIGKVWGTRELIPHKSYRLVYEIKNDHIWILALIHTARLWPLLENKQY